MVVTNTLREFPFYGISNAELANIMIPFLGVSEQLQNNKFYQYIKSIGNDELLQQLSFKYVTSAEFSTEINQVDGDIELSLFHFNIRSLNKNSIELYELLNSLTLSFDIIVLSEIWSCNIDLYHNLLGEYEFFYDLPQTGIVGGVGIYIKKTLEYSQMDDYKITESGSTRVESLWFKITKNSKKYIIGGLYRHPDQDISSFHQNLDNICSKVLRNKLPCIIAGDINIDLSKHETHLGTQNYVDNLISNNFLPAIMMPTRISDKSATTIDHIYYSFGNTTNSDITVKSGNIWCDITDHLPNYILFTNDKCKMKNVNRNTFRPLVRIFSATNIQKFRQTVSLIDWSELYRCSSANSAYRVFSETIKTCFEDSFPLVRLSRKRSRDKKWITAGIKTSSHQKSKLYKKWLTSRTTHDEVKYKKYRKVFKQTLKNAEMAYYKEHFDTKVNTIKQLWNNLNNIFFSSGKNKNKIDRLCVNKQDVTNPKDICNHLNKHFCSIGDKLSKSLHKSNSDDFLKYCPNSCKDSMYCDITNSYEIFQIISGFYNNKSPGLDQITPKILKEISMDVVNPLTYIFNLSLSTGIVPDDLKMSKVVPVFKKGKKDIAANYRPISLLSIFDKILEKLMYKRLYSYFSAKNFLYKFQFGFRKNHSTVLALMEVVDEIYSYLDKHEFVIGIYLDLQKAFDCVNHEILLKKLYHYGIRGTTHTWFQSYLNNRQQTTVLSDVSSDFEIVTCGVPQGSVLGPLLFLIYINDIQYVSGDIKLKLFADDTNLFVHGKNLDQLEETANAILSQLYHWCSANKLAININKTCYTVFGSKRDVNKSISLKINDAAIENVRCSRYLGIMIDNQLTWQDHIDSVYKKIIKFTGIFYKMKNRVSSDLLRTVYFAFVYPHLLYGIEIYGNTYSSHLSKLTILNNKLLRIIQNRVVRTPVKDLYITYNTLPLSFLHEFQILIFVHKFVFSREKLPTIFSSYFTHNSFIHSHDTRGKSDLHFESVQTVVGKRSIAFKGCRLWNKLPIYIKETKSVKCFKDKLKDYYQCKI